MALYFGSKKVAGNTTSEPLKNDIKNYTVTFDDSGNTSGISDIDGLLTQFKSKLSISSLFNLIKTGFNILNKNIKKYTFGAISNLDTPEKITEAFNNLSNGITQDNTYYRETLSFAVAYPPFRNSGGRWYVEGFYAMSGYEWQTAKGYWGDFYYRVKKNNVWSDWDKIATGNQINNIGNIINNYSEVTSVYGKDTIVTSLTLPENGTYIILGNVNINIGIDNTIINGAFYLGSGTTNIFIPSFSVRTVGSSGGGVTPWAIISTKTQCVVNLMSYGYSDKTYKFLGKAVAIRIK